MLKSFTRSFKATIISKQRRQLHGTAGLLFAEPSLSAGSGAARAQSAERTGGVGLASRRPPQNQRRFTSAAVEAKIAHVAATVKDPEIAWLFANCFPNTLDTTVSVDTLNGKPHTYVITGDIDAMWLRDSSAQVWPYLPLMK